MTMPCGRTPNDREGPMRLELTVLGSASQAPTRERGQGGYVLRWDDEWILFDPGEGCQRQLLHAHLSAAHITRVCITHFHGDHCLGLPGFLQSRALTTDATADALLRRGPGGVCGAAAVMFGY